MTGLFGMATKYAEAFLSVRFRTVDSRGEQSGGPMYYLSRGVPWPWLGRPLGFLFALFASIAAFGLGNMVQSNSVAAAIHDSFGVPVSVTGIVLAVSLGLVVLGGISSIGRFTGVFVPVMIATYMAGCGAVLLVHAEAVPAVIALIFREAFTGTAAVGGFDGASLSAGIRCGVTRGIFSNESGLGSVGIAAAAAQTREPARQALVSMTQTFIDTIFVCSFTGIAIVASGAWTSGATGSPLTQFTFRDSLPGQWGGWIVAVSLSMFAYSTILGWCYYGEKSLEYLIGERAVLPYRVLFVIAVFVGAVRSLDSVWLFSDVMNGLMALPNLVGLLLLSRLLARETQAFLDRERAAEG
jgi:AGCS family alanine or glycine:cation symporter